MLMSQLLLIFDGLAGGGGGHQLVMVAWPAKPVRMTIVSWYDQLHHQTMMKTYLNWSIIMNWSNSSSC